MQTRKSKINSASVVTLGCSKNVVDSESFIAQLRANNIEVKNDTDDADAMIINTCGFIGPAKEENVQVILEACELKKQGKLKKLIVTGCLSERYPKQLSSQIDGVDHFFGVNSDKQIIEALAGDYKHSLIGGQRILTPQHFTYIKISEGCDHPCSFCAIPLIRGKFRSFPEEKILNEISALAARGTREFVLIAQDSTYYGKDTHGKKMIAELLRKISDIEGVEWARMMYAYPTAFPYEVLDVIAERSNLCNYIDIPFQHASTKLLKSMRRGTTRSKTEELINRIREAIPNAAIRSTFIVGYPCETEEDFNELLDFLQWSELDRVGVFTYSREEDTHAFPLGDPVPEEVKQQRRNTVMELQQRISLNKNRQKIGNKLKVHVDEIHDGSYFGRTEHDAPEVDNGVYINSDMELQPGDFVLTEITDAAEYDLSGKAVKKL